MKLEYKLGKIIFDATDERCKDLLGKMVLASNIGKTIARTPTWCSIGVLQEVNQSDTDRPFTVKSSSGEFKYTFIREIMQN